MVTMSALSALWWQDQDSNLGRR